MAAIHILKLRLSFLAHDLRTFQSNPPAEARLSSSIAAPHHNIGPPNRKPWEALATPWREFCRIDNKNDNALRCEKLHHPGGEEEASLSETLGTFLDRGLRDVLDRRQANDANGDNEQKKDVFVLCASHDLAPLLQAALGLERGFDDAKEFKRAYKRWSKGC